MAGPSLAQIDLPKAIGIVNEKDAETALQIQELYRVIGTNAAEQAAAVQKGTYGKSGESLAVLKFQDEQQAIADTIKANAAATAGFSPDKSAGIQNILIQDITETGLKMRNVADKLAADKAVSIFDDPLAALANAFTIPWTEQELEGLAKKQANSFKTLNDVNSGLTNIASTAEALKGKVGAAGVAANAEARAADMERMSLQIKSAGLKDGIEALKFVRDADERQLNHIRIATEFYNNQRTQARADAHLELAKKQDVRESEAAAERLKENKAREGDREVIRNAENQMFLYANRARQQDGLLPYASVGEMKTKINQTPAVRAMLEAEIDRGRRLLTPGFAPTDSFGTSVAGKLDYIRGHGIEPRTPQEIIYAKTLLEAERRIGVAKAKGADFDGVEFIRQEVKKWENYKTGDASNPNAPVSYETLLNDPILRQNPLFMKVIAPTITDGNKKLAAEPNQVFASIATAMIADPKSVNPDQAARLMKFIYDKSTELNNKNSQMYKWLSTTPTKLTAELHIGIDPRAKLGADVVTATGAAMMASGVGVGPGAAVAGLGLAFEGAALTGGNARIDLSDLNSLKFAFTRKVISTLGFSLNTRTDADAFPPGAPATSPVSRPPLFERNRVLESK